MLNYLNSIAVFSESCSEIICVINEKFSVIELVAPVEFGQKPSCRLLIYDWIETLVKDHVRLRINRTVQPELLAMEADHLFVNRKLILRDGRYWL